MKPSRSRARIASAPDTRGSLGIACLEDGNKRTTGTFRREFFHIKFSRFFEVSDGFFDSLTLADRANFRAFCYVEITFLV